MVNIRQVCSYLSITTPMNTTNSRNPGAVIFRTLFRHELNSAHHIFLIKIVQINKNEVMSSSNLI